MDLKAKDDFPRAGAAFDLFGFVANSASLAPQTAEN
jgi:hypothetical protein